LKRYKKDIAKELEAMNEFENMDMILRHGRKRARKYHNLIIRLDNEDKDYRYFCTNCQQYHVDHKINVGKLHTCPHCHTKLQVGTKRNKIDKYIDHFTYVQKNKKNEVIFRVFQYERIYDKYSMKIYENAFEIMRINVDNDVRIIRYNYVVYYTVNFKQGKGGWKRFTDSYFKYYYINFTYDFCNRNLKNVLKGTQFQYSYVDKVKDDVNVMDYLNLYKLLPEIEMIYKMKLFKFMGFCINNINSKKDAKDVSQFLKENKKFFKIWSKLDPNEREMTAMVNLDTYDIKYARQIIKKGMKFNQQDYVDDKKLAKYLVRANGDYSIWKDYIEFLERIEYKIDKSSLFPSDLMKAHDKFFNKIKVLDNKEYEQDIIDFENMLRPYNYSNDKFTIYCARTVEEFANESAELVNCVRDYIPKVSHHQSAIFFLRENENIDKSFVTIEIDPVNKILLQCRARENGEPKKEVLSFVKEWCVSRVIDYKMLTYTV
jgi:hypothetical protein